MTTPGPFTFVVHHRAAPQGSKDIMTNAKGGKYMKESSAGVKPFRTAIRRAALGADGRPRATFKGPVVVAVEFEFRQAKSNVDEVPIGQNIGDLDKLVRAVFDGLVQAEVIEDDRYVVGITGTSKRWGPEDRVFITVMSAATAFEPKPSLVFFSDETESPIRSARAQNPFDELDEEELW